MRPNPSRPKSVPTLQEQLPELRPGQSVELLKELHILTREGKLNQDTRRKLKQVNHLVQFIEPLLQEVLDARGDVTLADHGAGKSYLGFILYDLFFQQRAWAASGASRSAPNWWNVGARWRSAGLCAHALSGHHGAAGLATPTCRRPSMW
jgi:hypothetical protein